MFTDIGLEENFTITNTQNDSIFDDLNTLLDYEVIVFSNTSGNNLLSATQQQNVEDYIDQGGAFLGIHAATDTYRDRSWPLYNSLVGGIVQSNPNHTPNKFNGTMDIIGSHRSTDSLPDPWNKREEYYYWERNGGQLDDDIVETLRVRETGDSTYDAGRSISWYKEFDSGARSYYTALGHNRRDYTDVDADFRKLIRGALCWCVEAEASILPVELISFTADQSDCAGNMLSWQIDRQINFSHFIVERSTDGLYYYPIYSTLNVSDISRQKTFTYTDESVQDAVYYYRLIMVDLDGSNNYSSVITASNNCVQNGGLLVYPNPLSTSQNLYVKWTSSGPSNSLSLYDKNGRFIRAVNTPSPRGEHILEVNLSGLGPDVYFIHENQTNRVTRFVVID